MSDIPAWLTEAVVARAGSRCEYCGLSQLGQEATFHVDHVLPRVAGCQTVLDNLALACPARSGKVRSEQASIRKRVPRNRSSTRAPRDGRITSSGTRSG